MVTSRVPRRQQGATLLVSMVLLLAIMLFAVSAIRTSTVTLKIAGNTQAREEAAAAAQLAIDQIISDPANFYNPVSRTVMVSLRGAGSAAYAVNVAAPACLKSHQVDGYSVDFAESAPKETYWDIVATVDDPVTGAAVTVHQGVRVRLNATAACA